MNMNKHSHFGASYADLMTALFFIMIVLNDIVFKTANCEVLICGSGDGRLSGTGLMREHNEKDNRRFLIHILPKPGQIE